jgi:hypothetical protein
MGCSVHEPTDWKKREEREALVKLAADRLSLHSPMHSVLARIEACKPLDSVSNPARAMAAEASKIAFIAWSRWLSCAATEQVEQHASSSCTN